MSTKSQKKGYVIIKPMVSILIPISNTEDSKLIDRCLKSLTKQTYKNFDVLIITSKNSAKEIASITKKYDFIKILEKDLGKSAARNFAAQKAKGEYLYHLDVNMALTPRVLSECVKKTKEGAEAIIIPDEEEPQSHFISQCWRLERRLLRNSQAVIAPLFLKKSLFEKAGGYDEDLDPADDWNLHLALKKLGVKPETISTPVIVKESTSFRRAFKRKYKMGRIYPVLKMKYPHPPHSNFKLRFEDYFRNRKELIKNPFISLGLFFLKLADVLAFSLGTLRPLEPKNRYQLTKTAEEYERKRLGNNFGRYKHFTELKSLFKLLPRRNLKILEVGCGTGRITEELIKRKYKVTPIDSSQAMITQYRQKPGLPKPQLANATQLPFPDVSFPIIFSLRVIWHLRDEKDRENMLSEAARVSSNSIILDITNKKRWPKFYRNRYPNEYFFTWEEFVNLSKKFNLKIEERVPLDTLAPFWFNFLPFKLATILFPLIYKIDLLLAQFVPPGRFLVKLSKL